MVAKAVGLMEAEEDNIMEVEEEVEEEKLHNNKLYKDSVEEEKLLFKKFVSISKLCSSDTAKIPCPPWLASTDQVIPFSLLLVLLKNFRWTENQELLPLVF